jgi:methylated-DNA-[protein]-cysteine S-methyltransferase
MKYFTHYHSPVGTITLQANDKGLLGAWFEVHTTAPDHFGIASDSHPILQQAVTEFGEYFAGGRKQFDVPTDAQGTDFQKQVWKMLQTIPFGETWSYQDLAIAINNPKAVRAVGLANGKNPISIIVPCHRVIGKNGKLTGYAGGIDRKEKLLVLEGVLAESSSAQMLLDMS